MSATPDREDNTSSSDNNGVKLAVPGSALDLDDFESPDPVSQDSGQSHVKPSTNRPLWSDMKSTETEKENPENKLSEIITLQVGERQFTTCVDTLTEQSLYFRALFSGRWASKRQDDGSFFLDADGDVFAHIMRYLRHKTFPVLYDRSKGHDHSMYMAILEAAEYLGISELSSWIKDSKYNKAISHTYYVTHDTSFEPTGRVLDSNERFSIHPVCRMRKVYLCPRGILVHRGAPEKCGQACRRALGEDELQFEEEIHIETLGVRESVTFHPSIANQTNQEQKSVGQTRWF